VGEKCLSTESKKGFQFFTKAVCLQCELFLLLLKLYLLKYLGSWGEKGGEIVIAVLFENGNEKVGRCRENTFSLPNSPASGA
jgi:hypothetical protein